MSVSQFRVTCDTYKNNIFCGFSLLQQKQEFVDMTFAAEGHFVKVHQSLVALCSPYIKEMLKSLSGQHPVIILNNVSYEILCFILEYIYTGEVEIPSHKLDLFIKAANSLNLSGIDKLEKNSMFLSEGSTINKPKETVTTDDYTRNDNVIENITINSADCKLNSQNRGELAAMDSPACLENFCESDEITNLNIGFEQSTANSVIKQDGEANDNDTTTLQFTVSNRGSLQIILNRYMYLTHHKAHGGRKRRWRCIDYRRLHCPAFVDTDGDTVVKRKYMHSHPFHDIKILKKIQRNLVYSSTEKALSILNATQMYEGNTCNEDNIMDESD